MICLAICETKKSRNNSWCPFLRKGWLSYRPLCRIPDPHATRKCGIIKISGIQKLISWCGCLFSSSETREIHSCVNIVSRASLELSSLANAKRKASDASEVTRDEILMAIDVWKVVGIYKWKGKVQGYSGYSPSKPFLKLFFLRFWELEHWHHSACLDGHLGDVDFGKFANARK